MKLPHACALAVVIATFVALPAIAQSTPSLARIPTVTRLVKQFYELENALVAGAHAKDAAALETMLDPSFEMRVDDAPGVPIPRDAWIGEIRNARGEPRFEQMAVHAIGDVALVSFRETAPDAKSARTTRERFVVDCWRRDGDTWKLAVRYRSDHVPGRSAPAHKGTTLEKRY